MNIRDIARLADVTPGTVSKVINNYPDISEATRQHVLRVIEENKYDPKANGRAKPNAEAPRIGLVVESVYNHLYSLQEDLLSRWLHNSGATIVSFHDNFFTQDKAEKFSELKASVERDRLSGLIYVGGNFASIPQAELDTLPYPTIFVNTVLPEYTELARYSSIQVSHFETAYSQMRYLIDRGHRDICTAISSVDDISVYGLRTDGYRAALNQARLEQDLEHFVEVRYRPDLAYKEVLAHLSSHPEITAVCCQADMAVPGVLRAIHDLGKVPGRDVAVISFDGLEETRYAIPSVTTFAQPSRPMTKFVCELLFGLLSRERSHQHIIFRPVLIPGESC